MLKVLGIVLAAAGGVLAATPAHAAGSTALPEPGMITLLSIAVAGVLIGRRFARKPPRD